MSLSWTNGSRWILAIGSILVLGSCFLQWWQIGGGAAELPQNADIGISDGRVFLMFLVAVATLLLLTLPYAANRQMSIDGPISYLILLIVALAGFGLRALSLAQDVILPIPPTRGLGFWIAALGLALMARGVWGLWQARNPL
jgi:hypothetical protein